jgi:hypothetical protein
VPSQHPGHLAAAHAEARTSRPSRTSGAAITVPSNRCFVNSRFWCRRLDLFGRELLAVDDTRIKAVNNKDRNFTR